MRDARDNGTAAVPATALAVTDETFPGASADTRSAPVRVAAFLVERFPPAPQLVLMVVLFVAATLMARITLPIGLNPHVQVVVPFVVDWPRAATAFLASTLFIVRLRVFDDVKDADTDRTENPTRPVPRGLVRERELDVTAALILLVEGALMFVVGPVTFTLWIAAAAWSVLMRVEFFVGEWLEQRIALYAISHMVVMGLIFGMLLAIGCETMGLGDLPGAHLTAASLVTSKTALIAMLAATCIGVGFEWGRKFDRYWEAHGELGWILWMLWPSIGVMLFTYLARDPYPRSATLTLLVVAMLTIVSHALVMGQRRKDDEDGPAAAPTGKLAEAAEALPGLAGLLCYLVLAVAGVLEVVG